MKNIIFSLVLLFSINSLLAQIPKNWVKNNSKSDEFNYPNKNAAFRKKWTDFNKTKWIGPGRTRFVPQNVAIGGGKLTISATNRPSNKPKETHKEAGKTFNRDVYTGFVGSHFKIKFPVYFEARIKVNGLVLASNFWAKQGNLNKTEIDVTETYGGRTKNGAHLNMNTNYHNFENGKNFSAQRNHKASDKKPLRNRFHKFSCLWQSKNELKFYLDGKQVRHIHPKAKDGKDKMRDPRGNNFLFEPLRIIFDVEEHVWLNKLGEIPSKGQLNNGNLNKMQIDWVRVYKPRGKKELVGPTDFDTLNIYPNPASDGITINGLHEKDIVSIKDLNGRTMDLNIQYDNEDSSAYIDVNSLANGVYIAFTSQGNSIKFVKN